MGVLSRPALELLSKRTFFDMQSLVWPSETDDLPLLLARQTIVYCGTNVWRPCTNVVDTINQDVVDMIVDSDYRLLAVENY